MMKIALPNAYILLLLPFHPKRCHKMYYATYYVYYTRNNNFSDKLLDGTLHEFIDQSQCLWSVDNLLEPIFQISCCSYTVIYKHSN